jgi:hypothetical protein
MQTPVVTLHEGNTPLIHAPRLAAQIAPDVELYLKFEGANPTGSFKDRGMTMAVSKAAEDGAKSRFALRPATPRPAPPPTALWREFAALCSCRKTPSRWANWRRHLCRAQRCWQSKATSTTPCASFCSFRSRIPLRCSIL